MADERKAGGSPTGGAKLAQAGKAAGQPSSVSPEGATAASAATLLRVGVALWCALFSFLVTNGVIYPAVAQVDPWIREWATGFSVVVLAALVAIMKWAPQWMHPRAYNAAALAAVAGYLLCDAVGFHLGSPLLLLAGSLLDSLAEAWLFVLAYMGFAEIDGQRRPLLAMGACLAAYLLQPFIVLLQPFYAVALEAALFLALFLCVRPLVSGPLRRAQLSEPQAEMAVTNPRSFLSFGHLLYVAVFVFSVVQGLCIALPGPFNDAPALPVAFVPLAIILLVYLVRGRMPNADGLFSLCALFTIAGMFLQPSDQVVSAGVASASNTLIDAGASCFNLLLVLLVGSIAARNRVAALPTAAFMLGLYWFGVGVGAVLGNSAMGLLGWTQEALIWASFASAMVFVVFCFVVLKNVSFSEAIGALQPPVPVVEAPAGPAEPSAHERCLGVAADYGLTPRETEVFELLAQGRTVGVICEKLVVSLNTARFHTKNIYAKLGVHSQQELIDLVERYES
ncbi:transcriptional regulator FimZ [Coriobacteriaceae bacterium CHKCI002]|nr:transcriptional regulator FimZ [Coriobacteriaceae bacterium CHKCI002]